ncbi:MAG: PASTA domain-containing protein [Clostridia bacterium]|nr:PASTA domain-containing protein [Clostridia bacterium]
MKYRVRFSRKRSAPLQNQKRQYRLRGRDTLRQGRPLPPEPIEFIPLYEFGDLSEEPARRHRKKKERNRGRPTRLLRALALRLRAIGKGFATALLSLKQRLRRPTRQKKLQSLPILGGALCAALLVSVLSAGGVLVGLFSRYGRSFEAVTVPDFLGKAPESVLTEEDQRIQLIIQYEYNPEVAAGLVISQSPRSGVVRRIYEKDGYCTVTLRVSRGEERYEVADLVGLDRREAVLTLKNQGLTVTVTEEYSSTAPKGTVIGTRPAAGSVLSEGDSVTLRISAGKQILRVSVPDLFGKTEQAASSLLSAAGLKAGGVSYQASSYPAGTVIEQSVAANTTADEGSTVSFTVSAGHHYSSRTVPDLYGMSVENAKAKLRDYGLVAGSVYSMGSASEGGTVIAQTPIAGTPITSSTVAVDLYVSS